MEWTAGWGVVEWMGQARAEFHNFHLMPQQSERDISTGTGSVLVPVLVLVHD